jgi:hypothetical protein
VSASQWPRVLGLCTALGVLGCWLWATRPGRGDALSPLELRPRVANTLHSQVDPLSHPTEIKQAAAIDTGASQDCVRIIVPTRDSVRISTSQAIASVMPDRSPLYEAHPLRSECRSRWDCIEQVRDACSTSSTSCARWIELLTRAAESCASDRECTDVLSVWVASEEIASPLVFDDFATYLDSDDRRAQLDAAVALLSVPSEHFGASAESLSLATSSIGSENWTALPAVVRQELCSRWSALALALGATAILERAAPCAIDGVTLSSAISEPETALASIGFSEFLTSPAHEDCRDYELVYEEGVLVEQVRRPGCPQPPRSIRQRGCVVVTRSTSRR